MSPEAAAQSALYALLAGDPTLAQVPCGVYDDVPINASLPYVVFGEFLWQPQPRIGKPAGTVSAALHVWGRTGQDWAQAGYKQLHSIVAQLDVLLDNQQGLAPTGGWTFDAVDTEQHTLVRGPDGETRHAVCRYRLIMEWT
jgi:hypothetical protein